MPHIRALFVENEGVMMLLAEQKTVIRELVAKYTSYQLEEIAFIPDMVPRDLGEMAENLLPLEFTIDVGVKCAGREEEIVASIRTELVSGEFARINFGIWLRTMGSNAFSEYKPDKKK